MPVISDENAKSCRGLMGAVLCVIHWPLIFHLWISKGLKNSWQTSSKAWQLNGIEPGIVDGGHQSWTLRWPKRAPWREDQLYNPQNFHLQLEEVGVRRMERRGKRQYTDVREWQETWIYCCFTFITNESLCAQQTCSCVKKTWCRVFSLMFLFTRIHFTFHGQDSTKSKDEGY